MAKSELKFKAKELRNEGKSIKWIARELGAAQSSVSLWCRDIKLSQEQLQVLQRNFHDPYYGKRLDNALRQQKERLDTIKRLLGEGKRQVGKLTKRELFLVGAALYWAEGFKKDSQAGLGSSDPAMMQFYVKWLRDCFGYTTDDLLFRVTINAEHEYRIDEVVAYWAKLFGVPTTVFQKPFFQHVKWKKQYEHPEEYFGVLRVRVRRSANLLRKIYGFIAGLKENVPHLEV